MRHHWRRPGLAAILVVPLVAAGLLAVVPGHATAARPATGPSTRQAVIAYLHQISGNHTVSGVHNKEPLSQPGYYTGQEHAITGRWPGLWGGELGFNPGDIGNRQSVVNQAKTEWSHGSLVALTWHMCPPTMADGCDFTRDVSHPLSDDQWNQVVTAGTALNTAYHQRLDEVVPYLTQLKDAGVPVLFRPLHEMNQGWSWWGGRPGANGGARLYQITHDYLVSKGLDNLVWVWNVKDIDGGAGGVSAYYPGANDVDVVSLDPWQHTWPGSEWYQAIRTVANGKPIALAEVGTVPSPSRLASQPLWTWFMIWSEYLTNGANTPDGLRATFNDPRVLSQGSVRVP